MIRILDIALKDLLQLTRDFKTFMFLLLMPIAFTFLFGYASGGFANGSDSRLSIGYIDQDDSWVSRALHDQLAGSDVIHLEENSLSSLADMEQLVADEELAAVLIVPEGYGRAVTQDKTTRLTLIGNSGTTTWTTVEAEILTAASRLDGAASTAAIMDRIDPDRMPYKYIFKQGLSAWEDSPIAVRETTSTAIQKASDQQMALSHTSPGMMLQFAIAGLLTAAQIIVTERKSRTFQRLLTTATRRTHVLFGHYLAIFILIFAQFTMLITFGQYALHVAYLRLPAATFLVAFCAALCIAALGLLIGIVARSEEQAISFSLIPMFVFAGLGGAWMPLEFTGDTFQTIGHLSPIAWGMDGFKNICVRGLGFESVLLPAAALAGYAVLFFALAAWRLNASEEK